MFYDLMTGQVTSGHFEPGEIDMHIINISSVYIQGTTVLNSLFLWHLTTRLNSSQVVTKLGPVGPALLILLLRRQGIALL